MLISQAFVAIEKAQHDTKNFDCGKQSMNQFLHRFSHKHSRLGLSETYVLTTDRLTNKKQQIASYFTLAGSTITKGSIPQKSSLPTYPIPVILLAKLAVDVAFQGQNLGKKTLIAALRKAYELNEIGLSAFGIILDVLDKEALVFYQQFNFFDQLSDNPMKLFVGMDVLKEL